MPTSRKARKALFSLLPESCENIFELGSGWGHLIFPLAKSYPFARIHAYEGSLLPWVCSKGMQKILRIPNLIIARKNFFTVSLTEADLVVCYLYPGAMRKLKDKFQKELKPGTLVATNTFMIPGWTPLKVLPVDDLWCSQVYLYRI